MDMNMDKDIIRERSAFSNKNSSRKLSILSQALSRAYHERIEAMNNLNDDKFQDPINSSQLSYFNDIGVKKGKIVRKMTDISFQQKIPCLHNEALTLNNIPNPQDEGVSNNNTNICPSRKVFDIQLPYDIN